MMDTSPIPEGLERNLDAALFHAELLWWVEIPDYLDSPEPPDPVALRFAYDRLCDAIGSLQAAAARLALNMDIVS